MFEYLRLHRYKILLVVLLIIAMQAITIMMVKHYQKVALQHRYSEYASLMNSRVQQAIEDKQKASVAIAVVLSATLGKPDIDYKAFHKSSLIDRIENFSNYKNIWIQIVDTNGVSLYRSWSEVREGLAKIRPEFAEIIRTGQPVTSISSGRFDLSIKAVVPIIQDDKVSGFIDLISHFNSIQRSFENMNIDSLVIATEERSKLLKRPFSTNSLGNHYVANLMPNYDILNRLTPELFTSWLDQNYTVWNDFLVVPYPLVASNGATHGHFLSFIPLQEVNLAANESMDAEQAIDLVIELDILLSILVLLGLGFVLILAQKRHYKEILDTENDLVLVTNGDKLSEGNRKLFEYFPSLGSAEKECVCDYFLNEDGYIQKYMDDKSWLDVLLENPESVYLAKVKPNEQNIILSVKAAILDKKRNLSVVVMSDITQLQELHNQSRTDALTRAGNRRSYEFQIKQAMEHAVKEKSKLGLLIFDIDDFKIVNDRYGHPTGDKILKCVADICFDKLGHKRNLFRVGGEEFIIILEEYDLPTLEKTAERIRQAIQNANLDPEVTISIGGTLYTDQETVETLYHRADKALYQAKEEGKNRVVIF